MGVGEVCGAVSGGVLAISLLYGQDQADATVVETKTRAFVRRFAELNGAVRCIDIIGFDVNSAIEGGADVSSIKGILLFLVRGGKKMCDGIVSSAVRLLLEDGV
jgi:C_GCAxxG_C_C family probable redox protein